jgi:predicted enzyme related to lactoylglutathione lyase
VKFESRNQARVATSDSDKLQVSRDEQTDFTDSREHFNSRHFTSPISEKETILILGLRTALYAAPDLARAKAWYSELLEQAPYFDQPFYVGFSVGGYELGLVPDAIPGGSGTQALWGVADADAAYARLVALGATALEPVTAVGDGIKVAAVTDPFGNRFSIIENPHFKPAEVR